MNISDQAWEKSKPIYQKIIKLPFIIELMNGSLNLKKFAYYLEQDEIYLDIYAKVLEKIAQRLTVADHKKSFRIFAEEAVGFEQESINKYYMEKLNLPVTKKVTTATLSYTDFLLRLGFYDDVEVAVAGILPCFKVYQEVGNYIYQNANLKDNNPFKKWIETYSSEEFANSVIKANQIFDELANNLSKEKQEKMINSYYDATCYEWNFWNDSYNLQSFHNI